MCPLERAAEEAESSKTTETIPPTESLEPAGTEASQGEVAAVQPVMGISQRVRTGPRKKKDLGMLGMSLLHQKKGFEFVFIAP